MTQNDLPRVQYQSLKSKKLTIKTVFIRIMEVTVQDRKIQQFCLNFRYPLWESSSEAERGKRERGFIKGK